MKAPKLLILALLLLAAARADAQHFSARILWVEKAPHLRVHFRGVQPAETEELPLRVALYDKEGKKLWDANTAVTFAEGAPKAAELKVEKIEDPRAVHRLRIALPPGRHGIEYAEDIYFAPAGRTVRTWGLRRQGRFPFEQVVATVSIGPADDANTQNVKLGVVVRDINDNVIIDKLVKTPLAAAGTHQQVDITPDRSSVGPYTLELRIENDPLAIYFSQTLRFAFANALIPVTSFELGHRRTWFPSEARPYFRSLAYYYSPQLQQLLPADYPKMSFDGREHFSGRQSLRIDYTQGREAHVFSRQVLPGLPTMLRLAVKGNGSDDELHIHYRDHIDLTRPAWQRNANFGSELVTKLDFEGWRTFRIPVLGRGTPSTESGAGSTEEIDAPIYLLAVTVKTPRVKRGQKAAERTVWLDHALVETQARHDQRTSIEVRADAAGRRLREDSRVFVSIGNGTTQPVEKGKIKLTAKDRNGKVLLSRLQAVEIDANAFAVVALPIGEAQAKNPLGPVDVDLSFVAPGAAGLRASERITFGCARSFGLWWDFEKPEKYNAYVRDVRRPYVGPSKADVKDGVLRLPVEAGNLNPLILHPAMPGQVEAVEVMVKGGSRPVTLQPLFVDSGLTGIWIRNFNMFKPEPIKVDWQGWRKVTVQAPPVPAHYQDRTTRYFFKEPYYPLNLLFEATVEGEEASEVFLDNIRVRTHLPPSERLMTRVSWPDDSLLHPPQAPLQLLLRNFDPAARNVRPDFTLQNVQGHTHAEGTRTVNVPAGEKLLLPLVDALSPGVYTLRVRELPGPEIDTYVQVLDPTDYFGEQPLEFLKQMPEVRKSVDMTVEKVYLDWDNAEPMPGLRHWNWFEQQLQRTTAEGRYDAYPVVGFCADWAGPHALPAIQKGTYNRYMGNYLQVPMRLSDWSIWTRECLREFKGRFSHWVFWENPDLEGAPQTIPQSTYPKMLEIFHKWVRLYDPKAKVVAGGFNLDRALNYLEQIENPHELKFDEIAVQMNLGELSPERADVEGFLDELNDLLRLPETNRRAQVTQMDWAIGEYVSAEQQANYHTRAFLILNSRGAGQHRFNLINRGQAFEGPGIVYRIPYGSSECLQTLKPNYVPKPAYFALHHTRRFLESVQFVRTVTIPDRDLSANRAFIYRGKNGQLTAVTWRTTSTPRDYLVPDTWKGARARDAYGFHVDLRERLRLTGMPLFIAFPKDYQLPRLMHELRTLRPRDGQERVLLVLHVNEEDSRRRAGYTSTGKQTVKRLYGRIPGGRKLRADYAFGLTSEEFSFNMEQPGDALMTRYFHLDEGQALTVQLNDGPKKTWALDESRLKVKGVREATFVLRGARPGRNRVRIEYAKPGNCAGYRVEPLTQPFVTLVRWGVLNVVQEKGELQKYRSAAGTPLAIGKQQFDTGLGSHARALIEYPLNGQFSAFEVKVGIDAVTNGRGSVEFEIHIDGEKKASSGLMTGFSKPKTLRVEGLEQANRMILWVKDAGDKNQDDLANWVEGKLILKK